MPSKSGKAESLKWLESKAGRSFLTTLRSIVSFWRGYIDLHSWLLIFYLLVLVVSGNLFSIAGLVLALGAALYVILYFLEKWLSDHG
jgi:hypothetical protein